MRTFVVPPPSDTVPSVRRPGRLLAARLAGKAGSREPAGDGELASAAPVEEEGISPLPLPPIAPPEETVAPPAAARPNEQPTATAVVRAALITTISTVGEGEPAVRILRSRTPSNPVDQRSVSRRRQTRPCAIGCVRSHARARPFRATSFLT
jgi:hypothetical protein